MQSWPHPSRWYFCCTYSLQNLVTLLFYLYCHSDIFDIFILPKSYILFKIRMLLYSFINITIFLFFYLLSSSSFFFSLSWSSFFFSLSSSSFYLLLSSSSFFLHTLIRQHITFINSVYRILSVHLISSLMCFVRLWLSSIYCWWFYHYIPILTYLFFFLIPLIFSVWDVFNIMCLSSRYIELLCFIPLIFFLYLTKSHLHI